jgi:apolipoprotein N-acyltransferase
MRRPEARAGVEALLLAGAGAVQTAAYVHTGWWWLTVAAVALLAWRVGRPGSARPTHAALLGWAFGTGWLCAGTWWLYISLHTYGGLPGWMAVVAVFLLAAALSLYLALAMAVWSRWRSGGVWGDAALFAAVWLLAELARGIVFTGFPWVASGYSQVDAPLAALAPWVGVYGVGALLAFAAALLAGALGGGQEGGIGSSRRLVPVAAPVGVALALLLLPNLAGPVSFSRDAGTISVSLLQTNVAQDEKFAAERMPESLRWVAEALQSARGSLVVAPETAVPLLPADLEEMAPGYWVALRRYFAQPGRYALVGVPLGDFDIGYTNSVVGLSAASAPAGLDAARATGTAPYRYDKVHLVPFGELIPTGFHWFTAMMNIPLGDFTRGPLNAPSFDAAGQRVAPNICYEDLFGEELALRFADPARAPTLFANVSNIGWFGDSIAIPQHLQISRFRTLEFQRPMIRATNTGATALIDHRGRVVASLPPFTRGMLEGSVQGRDGITPYAGWAARAGLWPLILLALAVVGAAVGRAAVRGAGRGRQRPAS